MIECIGRGGFATVYLAEHLTLKTFRAIKQISKSGIDRSLVLSEAELLKNLKHPGIPIIFDIEEDENNIYVIEEYIEGESLEVLMLQSIFITKDFIYSIFTELLNSPVYFLIEPDHAGQDSHPDGHDIADQQDDQMHILRRNHPGQHQCSDK